MYTTIWIEHILFRLVLFDYNISFIHFLQYFGNEFVWNRGLREKVEASFKALLLYLLRHKCWTSDYNRVSFDIIQFLNNFLDRSFEYWRLGFILGLHGRQLLRLLFESELFFIKLLIYKLYLLTGFITVQNWHIEVQNNYIKVIRLLQLPCILLHLITMKIKKVEHIFLNFSNS